VRKAIGLRTTGSVVMTVDGMNAEMRIYREVTLHSKGLERRAFEHDLEIETSDVVIS
jgi:hypothetical protein